MSEAVEQLAQQRLEAAECRLVRVVRDEPRHELRDLTVTTTLRGAFDAAYLDGDQSAVLPTDSQKNTAYAFARRHGVGSPERFLLRLAQHFVDGFAQVTGGRFAADAHAWDRIAVDGAPHDHAFVRTGRETRRTVVLVDGDGTHVVSGFTGATVLKSTGSEFHGFPRDAYTTLAETKDRVLATSVTAWWRWARTDVDFDARYPVVRDLLLATFAQVHSLALQHTIFAMGRAVLEACPDVAEVRLSCPNKHHFLVDLEPFGLENPGEVFHAADRPYGLIEAAVHREGDPPAPQVWASVPGFV